MSDLPPAAVEALLAAGRERCKCGPDYHDYDCWLNLDVDDAVALLAAAAPHLAEHVATKILAHMEAHQPMLPRHQHARRRHFGIAARVAAGAFASEDDLKRAAAGALADLIRPKGPDREP